MRHSGAGLAVLIATGTLCLGCGPQAIEPDLGQQLQSILDAEVQNNDAVRSAALHVDAPALGLSWEGAAGIADPENGRPMTPETPVRIASNTKTFVAAAVLRWAGAFGLFLAVIGIYGIVSFSVAQRTREMAIRLAIGADRRQVLAGVTRDGMRPALIGLGVGVVLALLVSRLLSGVLVGVGPMDPIAFGGGAMLLAVTAFLASLVPALRTLGIQPMKTLRDE